MDRMREHHVGIIVGDIEEGRLVFGHLGYRPCGEVVEDFEQHNRILFLENGQSLSRIELIEPLDGASTVRNASHGIHHICYETDVGFMESFKTLKIGRMLPQRYIAPALGNRQVVFACLRGGLYVEFLI
ncbi:MAG: VOC family protein [Lachnospiraceae bacterium]|nr:VOC family protein [Lachnospiraceae bacterium]